MPTYDLSPPRTVHQSLIALVALPACALSTWFTVRFCSRLCPEEGALELVAMAFVWEAAKLILGSEGQHNLARGTLPQRFKSAFQVAFSLLLAAGSIAASLGFFVQSDRAQQQSALSALPAYKRDAKILADLDVAIDKATALATKLELADHLTASGRAQERADKLRAKREALSGKMEQREGHAKVANVDFFEQVALVLSQTSQSLADSIRFGAHCILAIALETIGMVFLAKLRASFLFCSSEDASGRGGSDSSPRSLKLVQSGPGQASPGYRATAPYGRNRKVANGRGDTGTDAAHEHGTRYRTCTEEIRSGKLEPTYRSLESRFGVSHTTAGKWLHKMWEEQVLVREGRRFVPAMACLSGSVAT